jgi:hypothetical protein
MWLLSLALLGKPCSPPPVAEARLSEAVRVLAADDLEGRFTGSTGAASAARFLSRQFSRVGARPGVKGWLQTFPVAPGIPALREVPSELRPGLAANVVASIRGREARLRDEAVVVGAHYDHLGRGHLGSLGTAGTIHNGADDNASGSAALIEIARRLAACPPRRSVVVVAFSGEELGLLGSAAYLQRPVIPVERTRAMVNLDMVGRLRNDRLLVFGSETAVEFPALLDSVNALARFNLSYSGDGYGRSDQQSFYLARIPVLHLFTDTHEDYHRETDDADKVIVGGLARIAVFAETVVRAIADRPGPLTFVAKPPPVAVGGGSAGYGAYLGSIPDMGDPGPGVRLSGVREGSPAAGAGLRAGDVLLELGGLEITDLQAMTTALRSHQPGDTVMVKFRRGAVVDSVRVVLGRRGG